MSMENVDGVDEGRQILTALGVAVRQRATEAAKEAAALLAQLQELSKESSVAEIGARAVQQHIADEIGEVAEETATAGEEAGQLEAVITGTTPVSSPPDGDEEETDDEEVVPPLAAPEPTTAPTAIVRHPRNWGWLAWATAIIAGFLTLRFVVMPASGPISEFLLGPAGWSWLVTTSQWALGATTTLTGFYLGGWLGSWLDEEVLS